MPTNVNAIRAVVFDMDGLMFNTEEVFHGAGHELLQRRGKTMTRELLSRMMGRRARESFGTLIEVLELTETVEELILESEQIFYQHLETRLAPMPGLMDLLTELETRQLPKGVATSSTRPYAELLLGRFNLLERFLITLTGEDVTHGKPHPEIYELAAQRLGVKPQEMLVFEDSEAGSKAAALAGACVVAVPHDYSRDHDFRHVTYVAEGLFDPHVRRLLDGQGSRVKRQEPE